MRFIRLLIAIVILFTPTIARAQAACPADSVCVAKTDLKLFLKMAEFDKCRSTTLPKITEDPVTVIVDNQGRVFYTGNDPQPHKLHIDWCDYQIDANSAVKVQVADAVQPTWGLRFRAKAAFGILGAEVFRSGNTFLQMIDGGVLLEPFFIRWANVNAYVGVRSVGGGVGIDLTKTVGVYLGYAVTWWPTWQSNPYLGLSFSLW